MNQRSLRSFATNQHELFIFLPFFLSFFLSFFLFSVAATTPSAFFLFLLLSFFLSFCLVVCVLQQWTTPQTDTRGVHWPSNPHFILFFLLLLLLLAFFFLKLLCSTHRAMHKRPLGSSTGAASTKTLPSSATRVAPHVPAGSCTPCTCCRTSAPLCAGPMDRGASGGGGAACGVSCRLGRWLKVLRSVCMAGCAAAARGPARLGLGLCPTQVPKQRVPSSVCRPGSKHKYSQDMAQF